MPGPIQRILQKRRSKLASPRAKRKPTTESAGDSSGVSMSDYEAAREAAAEIQRRIEDLRAPPLEARAIAEAMRLYALGEKGYAARARNELIEAGVKPAIADRMLTQFEAGLRHRAA
jgi:hypothetical protein